jgi:class 3 adenylate cyclase
VWFEGDLFGATVNRAARLVAEAPPGSIAAGDAVRLDQESTLVLEDGQDAEVLVFDLAP